MATSKKSTAKKPIVVKVIKSRKPNPLHEKLIKLFVRPNGATIGDIQECGWKYSAVAALAIAKRRDLKTSVVKKSGELNRYIAKKGG
jgi:hypothetical protein